MEDNLDLLQRHRTLVALSSFSHRCTLHFSGEEFESLCKRMVDYIFGFSLEWTCAIFQIHEWKWFTFPQSEVLPIYLALPNVMYLHYVLCGSLGVNKFDIELVVSYFFENLLFLLILKCIVRYLGLLLIVILACDMLWFAYFKEVVLLHLSWLVFFSICLRTNNVLSMGEFDKHLKSF